MNRIKALSWKEWRETSPFLWIAWGIFLGLPFIDALEEYFAGRHRFEFFAFPWVMMFGIALPVFVAVSQTCRDLGRGVEDFWRSRPVGPVPWMLVKYVVGAAIVLAACLLPLILQQAVEQPDPALERAFLWLPVLLVVIYSVSFLAGSMVQRPAHAAVLAFAAVLIGYLLPMILPPLQWLSMVSLVSPDYLYSGWNVYWLLISALVITAVALFIVHQHWRIEPGPKFMYGSIAAAFLILLFTAGYHLGSNLPVLQQLDFPKSESWGEFNFQNGVGYVQTFQENPSGPHNDIIFWPLQLTPSGLRMGKPVAADQTNIVLRNSFYVRPARLGNLLYAPELVSPTGMCSLRVIELSPTLQTQLVDSIAVPWKQSGDPSPILHLFQNRLYMIGQQLAVFDLSNPRSPRLLSDGPLGYYERKQIWQHPEILFQYVDEQTRAIPLPDIPDLPPMERLKAAVNINPQNSWAFDGQIFCDSGADITEYRLSDLKPLKATFKLVGQYKPSMVEGFFGYWRQAEPQIENGLLYVNSGNGGLFNPRISVFDIRGHGAPRLVAHFASPGGWMIAHPLADGRAIIVGNKIWLVGPPPRHD